MAFKDKARASAYRKDWKAKNKEKVRESNRLSQRKWYWKHKEKRRLAQQNCEMSTKTEVLTHYGNEKLSCVRCDFSDIRALTIDHINGRGTEHRRTIKKSAGYHFYVWLRSNNYPSGYQTLCMNCQLIKKKENKEYADKE